MILTQRLIGYLHRVFDKDPKKFLALRLRYPGGTMAWDVTDGVLTTIVGGGSGQNLTVPLDNYTVSTLANFLGTQTGYVVEYVDSSYLAQLSARALIDGKGDQAASNGDHLYGYTSLLWVYMESVARELRAARQAISDMLAQLHIPTAEGEWIDEWGATSQWSG